MQDIQRELLFLKNVIWRESANSRQATLGGPSEYGP